ncbi:MAG: leucyl/phenylalanyl-tRNA--protein transferase [gamma proteobacterium symbiont of Lucinoma myriamae]|nr:leucyl/phenylalanyl-tRNA--protein transferase [gamma proteobacterium symbiont of Lucinoma myriamae]MCU7819685.1 leucyl/phenylalanyl-tRNA--protein transferase [gamma proteobacterium symbiont of Lucinoma myriamae]MCU7831558.1 leucyl/phenylalanyl-tRNA--protein transferase [gamma proteobacterium symbiont of Lucinoma myriamae]
MTQYPIWLKPEDNNYNFPHPDNLLTDPDGLLAIGGDLSPERIVIAYLNGIFPWYSPGQPILWWSPDPRAVLFPEKLHVSKSLKKIIRKKIFTTTIDQAFEQVIHACSQTPRKAQDGTWIDNDMQQAYINLHKLGIAHSAECWQNGQLVGGLYGIALGKVFFGESMFSLKNNASKVAFVHLLDVLTKSNYALIDCQVTTAHLLSLGAEEIPRNQFLKLIAQHTQSFLDTNNNQKNTLFQS